MFCNMEGEACTNFVDLKAIGGKCQFIEKTDQSLVRGSPSSKNSLKVWTKETIETGFVFNTFLGYLKYEMRSKFFLQCLIS
mgnify:CR=1 FL=1